MCEGVWCVWVCVSVCGVCVGVCVLLHMSCSLCAADGRSRASNCASHTVETIYRWVCVKEYDVCGCVWVCESVWECLYVAVSWASNCASHTLETIYRWVCVSVCEYVLCCCCHMGALMRCSLCAAGRGSWASNCASHTLETIYRWVSALLLSHGPVHELLFYLIAHYPQQRDYLQGCLSVFWVCVYVVCTLISVAVTWPHFMPGCLVRVRVCVWCLYFVKLCVPLLCHDELWRVNDFH